MNRAKLKNYAAQARRDFIQAMTDRAGFYGLTAKKTEPVFVRGDMAIIGGREHPRTVAKKRQQLEDRIQQQGFDQTMETIAYTWFNRFVAIRYMELHGYLDHGYRVLSARNQTTDNTDGTDTKRNPASSLSVSSVKSVVDFPEILTYAEHVDLPGLKKEAVIDLKLAGNKESELYRLLLTAQCNALHAAMPFLFEKIDDETELLLPDNLLHSDSLIRKLVGEINEDDWQEVEIIGWLYQFYISDKKDAVIGKVVASEDIPAATQLFTPNWIAKYLVQNTLGRQWLEHHPNSPLKAKMEYYIEPAEQTPEVQEQLNQLIRKRATDQHGRNTEKESDDLSKRATDQHGRNTEFNLKNLSSSVSLPCPSVANDLPKTATDQHGPNTEFNLKNLSPSVANDLSLNPELLTLLDPACGSGHLLVEGYDLFKAIYTERGYNQREIPRLILEKNLFGLEIDDRAAQLASFALMMKARADDRRIFDSGVKPNIVAFQESKGMNAADITHALNSPIKKEKMPPSGYLFEEIQDAENPLFTKKVLAEKGHVSQGDITTLLELFENAKTFGSLIQIPAKLAAKLPEIEERTRLVAAKSDTFARAMAAHFLPLLQQARLLAREYDAVVANPPYMGGRNMNKELKEYGKEHFTAAKADLFAMFISRAKSFTNVRSAVGMVTMHSWMFLSSFEAFRAELQADSSIISGLHMANGVMGIAFGTIAAIWTRSVIDQYRASYCYVNDSDLAEDGTPRIFPPKNERLTTARQSDFRSIPGQPIAYWISERMRQCFRDGTPLGEIAELGQGMATSDNGRFLRLWPEVSRLKFGLQFGDRTAAKASGLKWFPYNKGGEYRRWFGNNEYLVNWENDGSEVLEYAALLYGSPTRTIKNIAQYFRPSLTWSFISSSFFAVRCSDAGFLFDVAGSSAFPPDEWRECIAGFLCSSIAFDMMKVLNPTMNFQVGNVAALPILQPQVLARKAEIVPVVREAVQLSRTDWDSFETSWGFATLPVLQHKPATLQLSQEVADAECLARFSRMKVLEEENNRLFIDAYGLQDELSAEVADDQITLYRPDREEDIKRLLSYALGCVMGRYSLDKPGLIYAHSGNDDFEKIYFDTEKVEEVSSSVSFPCLSVAKFRPDPDGIVPLTETDWFPDDAANRIVEFVGTVWPNNELATDKHGRNTEKQAEGNLYSSVFRPCASVADLDFIEKSLGTTIRRYLATGFYKHHLQTYKRRPIYWLFSSGKLRAFQCLVYLHRYHEGTLARMRTEYVIPLQGQIAARIEQLEADKTKATSTSHRKSRQKEQDDLKKQEAELRTFEEKLKHAADQKIRLDLDDGVKVNYGKFGDLLAEAKAICGSKEEE